MGNQEENEHKIDESSKNEKKSHIANRYIKVFHHIEFGEMQQVR